MGIQLNKEAYQKMIDENIAELEKHMPEHSLEKKHTIEVLKWSIDQVYTSGKAKSSNEKSGLHIACVRASYLKDAYDICEIVWDFMANVISCDGDEATQSDIDKYNKSKRYCKWFNSL